MCFWFYLFLEMCMQRFKTLFTCNVCVCICIERQERVLWQQVIVFTLNLCVLKIGMEKIKEKCKRRFFAITGGHKSFLWDHWYPCFGLLVISPLGFKARVDSLICTWRRRTCYTANAEVKHSLHFTTFYMLISGTHRFSFLHVNISNWSIFL